MLTWRHNATTPAQPLTRARALAQQELLDQHSHMHARSLQALSNHS